MKALWARHLPQKPDDEQHRLVDLVHDCGFDTVIVPLHGINADSPTQGDALLDRVDSLGMNILSVVPPYVSDERREAVPAAALQRVHPAEQAFLEAVRDHSGVYEHRRLAHHWVPPVLGRDFLCFEHPRTQSILKERVAAALEVADGIALDGFGFRNQYACFCERCRDRRDARAEQMNGDGAAALRETSEETLVETAERLYDHAKTIDSDAIVTNHLWPPFRPNPTYGHRLELDYCSQTISWFYRPTWSLERVEFEAAEHKRLETPTGNRFVPFVAMDDTPGRLRSADRLSREFEIALEYGEGNVVFSKLAPLDNHIELRAAVRDALAGGDRRE